MRRGRLLEALPVVAALLVHGVAFQRWALVVPAAAVLVFFILRGGSPIPHRSGSMVLAGAAGGVAGAAFLLFPAGEHFGPLPPAALDPLCGALAGLAIYCALSRTLTYAWTYAWLLAVLSEASRDRAVLWAAGLMCLCTLIASSAASRFRARADLRSSAGWVLFALLLAAGTWGFSRAAWALEGTLMGTLMELVGDQDPKGFGLSETLVGGPVSRVKLSARPLFEISGQIPGRLRMAVFDRFDGYSWWTSQALYSARPALASGPLQGESELEFLEDLTPHNQVMVSTPAQVALPQQVIPAPAGVISAAGVDRVTVAGGWILHSDGLKDRRLRLAFGAPQLPAEPAPGPEALQVPDDLRRELEPLVGGIVGGAKTPEAQARAVEQFFAAHFAYALDVDLRGSGHPLTVLIREHRAAYCAYFAGAMAAVMRVLGVPARVVGGYVPEEHNPLSSTVTVRERDAHAWVEVYLADRGRYVAFDPTPWSLRDAALGVSPRLGLFAGAWQALPLLLRWFLKNPVGLLLRALRSPIAWLLLAAAAAWILWKRRGPRPALARAPLESSDLSLRRAHQRFLDEVQRLGARPSPADTGDDLTERLRALRGAETAASASAFLDAYRGMRFRGDTVSAHELERLLGQLSRPKSIDSPGDTSL